MSIDPRLAERRREVAEGHARRNVRRLLRFIAILTVVGGLVWLALSPLMSASRVRVAGVVASDTEAILAANGVTVGTPLVLIGAAAVEAELEADPWVVDADVQIDWPNDIVVRVEERVPRAWVETEGGWSRRAVDGGALPGPPEPDNTLGWVHLPLVTEDQAPSSEEVIGSVEFLDALPPDLATSTSVRLEGGELWAVVAGYQVRLGRAVEMRDKATSLVGLIATEPPSTATLVLIAPTRPAVMVPGGGVQAEETTGETAGETGG
jgi:cell division protein FtsQ